MKSHILFFFLGVLSLHHFSRLPSHWWSITIGFLLILLIIQSHLHLNKIQKYFVVSAGCFLLGFHWSNYIAHWQLDHVFILEEQPILVSGYINSLPSCDRGGACSFLFKTKTINNKKDIHLIKLSNRETLLQLKGGDEWIFKVVLKKIHGTQNLGGFDYEAWAYQNGIIAEGHVVHDPHNKLLNHPISWLRFRQYLKDKIDHYLPHTKTSSWIEALTLGERHQISEKQWDVLRNTGTNHLMAIAGLHMGFVGLFVYFFVTHIWRLFPGLSLYVSSQVIGTLGALMICFFYGALSGFSLPALRAFIMMSVFSIAFIFKRRVFTFQGLFIALMMVLILYPADVLSDSFWLSFGSVFLIIYAASGRFFLHEKNIKKPMDLLHIGWEKWGRLQWILGIGLVPFTLVLFQQFSLISFIANAIAIPWLGFFILPFCLIGSLILPFSTQIGILILTLADKSLNLLWGFLTYLSALPCSAVYKAIPNQYCLVILVIAIFILLLPAGFPGRWIGCIGLLPVLFYKPLQPPVGEIWFYLLDVGQGLSAVVQTKNHLLVYDTGPKTSEKNDAGEHILIPFLNSLDIKKIDRLIISHGDNDHIGGAPSLLKRYPVASIFSSVPNKLNPYPADYCLAGKSWMWDNVFFDFLYPTQDKLKLDNNSSCVLRITTGNEHILLTGDIEKLAENELLMSRPEDLSAQILVAPHHGSKTSGEEKFIEKVHPQYVLYAIGYHNRYHFPHASVVNRYNDLQAKQWDTASQGTIQFKIVSDAIHLVEFFRHTHHHFWNN